MNRREIDRLTGLVERKGYTLIALELYWSKSHAKLEGRPREGQEAARQARHGKGSRLGTRQITRDDGRIDDRLRPAALQPRPSAIH